MQQKSAAQMCHTFTNLFRHVINKCLLSLGTEFPSLLLQCCEPVEHGLLATGLQRHHPTLTGDLKLMLAEVLQVIGQCGG